MPRLNRQQLLADEDTLDGAWFEQQLGRDERRRRGHYATPPELVARILQWVGYRVGADLEQLALLDPACGSGNFLAGAAQVIIAHGRALGWPVRRTLGALQSNLWGLEMDPAACALAEMRLRDLARGLGPARMPRFHIHQADALALPAAPRYAVVVGNPPYLASRHHDLQAYQQGYLSNGQRDAYLLFLEQACHFVAPEGWLGLVLSDAVLARGNAADARRLLLESFTVRRLLHLEKVFRAEVGTLVLIAQRAAPTQQYVIPWRRANWRAWRVDSRLETSPSGSLSTCGEGRGEAPPSLPVQAETNTQLSGGCPERMGTFGVAVWRRQTRAELRYLLGDAEAALFERLAREVPSEPLGDLAQISRGEELAQSAAQPAAAGDETLLPVLRGGLDVRPFCCRFAGVYLRREQLAKPLERYRAPKLLVVKSTGMLQAALDEQGYVAMQTLYLLHPRTAQPALEYLLGLLNSRLLRGYLWLHHTAYKLVQPQLEQEALGCLPVPLAAPAQQRQIAALAGELREALAVYDVSFLSTATGGWRLKAAPGGLSPAKAACAAWEEKQKSSAASLACGDAAAQIQLEQTIADLYARLDASIAALCGLTAAEQALLEALPVIR